MNSGIEEFFPFFFIIIFLVVRALFGKKKGAKSSKGGGRNSTFSEQYSSNKDVYIKKKDPTPPELNPLFAEEISPEVVIRKKAIKPKKTSQKIAPKNIAKGGKAFVKNSRLAGQNSKIHRVVNTLEKRGNLVILSELLKSKIDH